jgi:hypothetical protein
MEAMQVAERLLRPDSLTTAPVTGSLEAPTEDVSAGLLF